MMWLGQILFLMTDYGSRVGTSRQDCCENAAYVFNAVEEVFHSLWEVCIVKER